MAAFEPELARYVRFRVEENRRKAGAKTAGKKA